MTIPSGTVTFLFTDIEGSTKLAQEYPDQWEDLRARHHAILQTAMDAHNGYVFQIIGDAFCVAFHTAGEALRAAVDAQRQLQQETWTPAPVRVRIGINTGTAQVGEDLDHTGGYKGYTAMARVQRLMSAAHGGQIVISLATEELVRDDLPKDVSFRDLGERRLKDLIRPERIFQVITPDLPTDFPPLKTLDVYRHNLPIQMTSFIGREKEMIEIKQAITRPFGSLSPSGGWEQRLVTLTGVGGTGKTRLSLQVTADLIDDYPDGVWLVELAPISDPALLPQTIMSTFGLHEQPGRSSIDILKDFLSKKNLLLLLDNCEHLIEACAQLADTLLHAAPRLKILATSREALGIAGESAYPVRSLPIPDLQHISLEKISQYDAVQLFIDRAVAGQPDFQVTNQNAPAVAEVCVRLDGIPLAIELAAARVKGLSVEQIASRLNDRFRLLTGGSRTALPRQRTLQATIDWSYKLLSEEERMLLRYLAVFAGGWTLEAAESVCADDGLAPDHTLDLLLHLVDKSLVVMNSETSESRYFMLETIRQYAQEKLDEAEESNILHDQHLAYFVKLAEQAERDPSIMTSAERKGHYARLDMEQENFRAAMAWALAARRTELGLRLVGALGDYWFWSANLWDEGWSWISQFLAQPESAQLKHARANALKAALNLLLWRGEYAEVDRLANESLALFRALGDKNGQAWVLVSKGWNLMGEANESESLIAESLMLFREVKDQRGIGMALWLLSAFKQKQDLFSEAAAMLVDGITALRTTGDDALAGQLYASLGYGYLISGSAARAIELLSWAVTLSREGGDEDGACATLITLAWAWLAQGDVERAAFQLEVSEAYYRKSQFSRRLVMLLSELGYVRHLQGNENAASVLLHEAIALYQEQKNTWGLIKSLELFAWIFSDLHQPQRAAQLFGAAEAGREQIGARLQHMRSLHDRHVEQARVDSGETAFEIAWAEGRALSMEQAIKLALEELDG